MSKLDDIIANQTALRADMEAVKRELGISDTPGATQEELDALGKRLADTTRMVESIDPPEK